MRLSRKQLGGMGLAVAFGLAAYFLWRVRGGLYPFFLGMLSAYLLYPAALFFTRRGLSWNWSLAVVFAAAVGLLTAVGALFVPFFLHELEGFAAELPDMTARVETLLHGWQENYQSWSLPQSMRQAVDAALLAAGNRADGFVTEAIQGILASFSYVLGIAVSPVLAFYILQDWRRLRHGILTVFPAAWQPEAVLIGRDINRVLHGVIRGQLLISLLVGLLVTLGLWFIGIRYAALLGFTAGILDIIPYFGAVLGAVPAIGAALLYSPAAAVQTAALFFFVHQTESAFIQPKIIGDSVGLHPLSVIFFVFVGEEIGGLAGMLLGVPAAAALKVLFSHILQWIIRFRREPYEEKLKRS